MSEYQYREIFTCLSYHVHKRQSVPNSSRISLDRSSCLALLFKFLRLLIVLSVSRNSLLSCIDRCHGEKDLIMYSGHIPDLTVNIRMVMS